MCISAVVQFLCCYHSSSELEMVASANSLHFQLIVMSTFGCFHQNVQHAVNACSVTISSHASLRSRQQESEEPLGIIGLRHGLTQTVDEDCSPAVGLQHGAEQTLEEAEELLVLRRHAHLTPHGSKQFKNGSGS